ncbi:uncharacterized protein LOC144640599 [Oculina patagonica]
MAGSREKRTLSQLESAAGQSQYPKMICTDRNEYDEVIIAAVQALRTKIIELENIITEQQAEICDLKGHLMRKHIGRVHTSSQTEAAPVVSIKPTPPKEGAPRKNVRHHRRHKTYPQDGRPLDSCNEKASPPDVGIGASLCKDQCKLCAIISSHILTLNPREGAYILIRFPGRKRSKGLHQDVQRLTLSDGHDPQTAQPLTETLPRIQST